MIPTRPEILGSAFAAAAYVTAQATRIAWYLGQYAATRRWLARVEGTPPPGLRSRAAGGRIRSALAARALALLARDLADIQDRVYPPPPGLVPKPASALAEAARYWRDLPSVALRRRRRRGRPEGEPAPPPVVPGFPDYYLQSFHDQSGGWLTADSAALYDTQVEILFGGLADAMRRRALPPIGRWLADRGARNRGAVRLLDLGTGTGALPLAAAAAFPGLDLHALDLSAAYLDQARRRLAGVPVTWHRAAAEAIPLPDASVDIVTAVYLLHELPPEARRAVLAEAARVLRPGGRLVVVDALQLGDAPALDPVLRGFPDHFHEPYFRDWIAADLPALLRGAGFVPAGTEPAYLSKVLTADRPLPGATKPG